MSTLAQALAIGDTQALLDTPLSGVGPAGFAVKIDSELLQVGGIDYRLGTTLALSYPATAAHAANATVTPVLDAFTEDASSPFASGGGSGIPQGGPLTQDLDVGGQDIIGTPGVGVAGGEVNISGGDPDDPANGGGAVNLEGGYGGGDAGPANITLRGSEGDVGGDLTLGAGDSAAGALGGQVTVQSGAGDAGNDDQARIVLTGGSGTGDAGRIKIQTDNDTGASGDLLTAQGDGTALWVAPAGGAGTILSATVDLDAADIATLSSVPVEVVAAPGADKVIVPVAASFQYKAGAEPFGLVAWLILMLDSAQVAESEVVGFDDVTSMVASLQMAPAGELGWVSAQSVVDDLPLLLSADPDPSFAGPILTSSIFAAGTDYEEDDEIILIGNAVLVVDTVDAGGEVLTYHITDASTGYTEGETYGQSSTDGAGVDFTLLVDTITPLSDGTARLTVLYYVMDLLV